MDEQVAVSIVDDDASVREALVELMQAHGYVADSFPSAADYLQSQSCGECDCLIADIHMPGMSGIELHGRLVASGRSVPTILITARHDEATRRRALDTGALCYFPKPFKVEELMACIRAALVRPGRRPFGSAS